MRIYGRMTREKSAQMHAAKERQRMAEPPPDYPAELDYEAPVESWTFKDYRRERVNKLVLFHSRRRRGCFRVVVNGREWNKCIGYDRIMRATVKSLSRI
jgi:hypothetical protein